MERLEAELNKWMKTVKNAMYIAIPKSNLKRICQLNITEEIKNLEREFKILRQTATKFGWTNNNHREYLRIRTELREKCKEAHNRNWEVEIIKITDCSKNTKEFWNKIKAMKGKNVTYINHMVDTDGRKYYTDKKKCELLGKTWENVFIIIEDEEENFDK